MVVLCGAALEGNDRATVGFLEVAKGKADAAFRALGFPAVNSQMPFGEIVKTVLVEVLVFVISGRRVLAPVITDIPFDFPLLIRLRACSNAFLFSLTAMALPPAFRMGVAAV
ncbi:hypothetical protein ACW0JT_24615 [Arthrobacter sp. SA17]